MTLPNEINTATRSLHTRLNALITSRLPLALPPHSSSPDLYLTGILPFVQVFIAFEQAWEALDLRNVNAASKTPKSNDSWVDVPLQGKEHREATGSQETTISAAEESALITALLPHLVSLRPRGLARANRIRRDVACLGGVPLDDIDAYLNDHASDTSLAFSHHIASRVEQKPQVLIAYAFVLYMAIFSGGRWIRSVLASPGALFWSSAEQSGSTLDGTSIGAGFAPTIAHEKIKSFTQEEQTLLESAGLSFWFWSGLDDGLDIKADFKKQLDNINEFLTDQMRNDVIAEAREIFIRCAGLVAELDERVGRQGHVINGIATIEQREFEAEKAARAGHTLFTPVLEKSWTRRCRAALPGWVEFPGYKGWALVFGCLSWFAFYQAGTFGYKI